MNYLQVICPFEQLIRINSSSIDAFGAAASAEDENGFALGVQIKFAVVFFFCLQNFGPHRIAC